MRESVILIDPPGLQFKFDVTLLIPSPAISTVNDKKWAHACTVTCTGFHFQTFQGQFGCANLNILRSSLDATGSGS